MAKQIRKVPASVKVLWRIFWIGALSVAAIFIMAATGVFGKMPSIEELQNPEADLASEIYSADGLLMGKYYAENRSEVKYREISPNVIHALIATEDERFYDHSGIDAEAVGRAIFTLGAQGGGSTITQQLAKMMLGREPGSKIKVVMQKVKEWIVAVQLERNFTKEEILGLYLNRAPWGNVYGIRNASRTYYQKEPADLTVDEAAVLVGMLKGFIYEPVRFPKNSIERRNTVIGRMVVTKQKYLTPAQGQALMAKPLVTNYKKIDEAIGIAPHFRKALLDLLKPWLANSRNPKTSQPYNVYRDGLKLYTTIDSRMQKIAEEVTARHMPQLQKNLNSSLKWKNNKFWKGHEKSLEDGIKFSERRKNMKEAGFSEEDIKKSFEVPVKMKIFSWWGDGKHERDTVMTPMDSIKYHKTLMQTSFVAMDPRSGEVKCWVGGIDYRWFKYDHVTAKRQVGSTFKPLLYTLAVTDAGYGPDSYIQGGAVTLSGKTISFGGGTLSYCLARSINGAAWRLMQVIGVKRTVEFSKEVGITTDIPPYPSIALGSAEIPIIQMLQSYTMYPNKGFTTAPVYVTRVEDKNGNLIYEFPVAQSKQVIGEIDAYTMVKVMEGVIKSGTARSLSRYNIPVEKAGKTGTTNGNTDGWFIGYTPELVAGTWVGCDDPFIPIYNNAGGSEMSAPRWGMFMEKVYASSDLGYKQKTFDEPATLKNDPIFADTRFDQITNMGSTLDEDLSQDFGNGQANDYFSDGNVDNTDYGDQPEPEKPEPAAADTAKKPKQNQPAKPATKPAATPAKPAEEKKSDYERR